MLDAGVRLWKQVYALYAHTGTRKHDYPNVVLGTPAILLTLTLFIINININITRLLFPTNILTHGAPLIKVTKSYNLREHR
jgi:hypothetical protein